MTADADVTATFTAGDGPTATLTTIFDGDGTGTLTADGPPCSSGTCTTTFLQGSSIVLNADAGSAARFLDFQFGSGGASACGLVPSCSFTLSGNASVRAVFTNLASFTVSPSSDTAVVGGARLFTAHGFYSFGVNGTIPPGRGDWAAAPSLPLKVEDLAVAALGGKLYAFGGGALGALGMNQLSAFDPVTQTWTSRAPMLVSRVSPGAAVAGGQIYAIGGSDNTTPLASVERYDPVADTWTMRASMPAARQGLVAGTVNGIVYAAGGAVAGSTPVGTLDAYDPATDTWFARAPMPTPRSFAAGGVVDGMLYVAGGSNSTSSLATVEAYDPVTNTWTTKASMPAPLATATAAVADGVIYVMAGAPYRQSVVYAYDTVGDFWTVKAPMRTPRAFLAAASLNGVIYAVGGEDPAPICCDRSTDVVETYVDAVRWSSSAPSIGRIDQHGFAIGVNVGTTTIAAMVGAQACGTNCATLTVQAPLPTDMSLDAPADNNSLPVGTALTIRGWALNRRALTGTGIDAIHVYAVPASGPAIFLGVANYGGPRTDVAAIFGAQFIGCAFSLQAGGSLAAGTYTIVAFAHDALTAQFDAVRSARVTLVAPASHGFLAVDAPSVNQTVTAAFEVTGWALDTGAPSGTGVDAVQFYVQPPGAPAPGVFIGAGSYGWTRSDVGAIFGPRFANSGYHFTITGMSPGSYTLNVYAHSTVTNGYSIFQSVPFRVNAFALMSIDLPSAEATISSNSFLVAGWSIDRAIEGTPATGTGVDALHVYAFPNPGSGQAPIFVGVATYGVARPDVGTAYGARYNNSGYEIAVDRAAMGLAPGVYNIAVVSHSAVSGTFNTVAVVRVALQ